MEKNKNYIAIFDQLASEIENHHLTELVQYRKGEPLSIEVLRIFQEKNFPLGEELKLFFQQCNGIYLRWRIKDEVSPDELKAVTNNHQDYYYYSDEMGSENPFACINLLPLHELKQANVLFVDDNETPYQFLGKSYSLASFSKGLRLLDSYSDFEGIGIWLGHDSPGKALLLLTDHYDRWYGEPVFSFSSYINFIAQTKGICSARQQLFDNMNNKVGYNHDTTSFGKTPILFSSKKT